MRKTKEYYLERYEEVMKLWQQGIPIKEIASRLGLSYSAVYAWIKGRKPKESKIIEFIEFLRKNGPTPLADMRKKFPKHSEIYFTALHRGYKILRYTLPRKFGDYSIWYLLPEQEEALKKEIEKFLRYYDETKKKLAEKVVRKMEEKQN